jgi:hypothetical protein
MQYLQGAIIILAVIALLAIVVGAIRNVHGPRKGKYRTSWFEKK